MFKGLGADSTILAYVGADVFGDSGADVVLVGDGTISSFDSSITVGNVITGGRTGSCEEGSGTDTGEEGAVEDVYESVSGD